MEDIYVNELPKTQPIMGGDGFPLPERVQLLEPLIFIRANGRRCVVPKDYWTDGASIPRFFWRVIGHPFSPRVIRAAILHDYAYSEGGVEYAMTKRAADKLFREILLVDGIGKYKAATMYRAVRWGGRGNFKK